MQIDRNRVTLFEDTYLYVGRASNEENAQEFKNKMQKYIEIIDKLINFDFKKSSDREFYKLLVQIYWIKLDKEDYLEMLSKKNEKKYTKLCSIPTTMTFKSMVTEGHGKDFSWWNELFQLYYNVAVSEEIEESIHNRQRERRPYTKAEIRKMLDNNDIVIFNAFGQIISNNDLKGFKSEEYEKFPSLDVDFDSYGNHMSKFIEENFELFNELLREKFSKKIISKDMRAYLKDLQIDIDNIFELSQTKELYYSEIGKLCRDWYNTSGIKEKHNGIMKTLNRAK